MDKNYLILVIDDDLDILKILKDNLELDGYRVCTATLGKDALAIFQKRHIDLVILDLMLPDMDGIQVCRAIRARSDVSIIMLTAKDSVTDKVLGLENGADDYIVKPFEYLEMAARIKARLRRSKSIAVSEEVHEDGNIRLDPNSYNVFVDGRHVKLTKKEFDLLHLLLEHSGKVLERDHIRQALWPDSKLYKWSRTIDVHIMNLRAKLAKQSDNSGCIVTVPGVGYMLKTSGMG